MKVCVKITKIIYAFLIPPYLEIDSLQGRTQNKNSEGGLKKFKIFSMQEMYVAYFTIIFF